MQAKRAGASGANSEASRLRQAESNQATAYETRALFLQSVFLAERFLRVGGGRDFFVRVVFVFVFVAFFLGAAFGALAATISYDCRINSFVSSVRNASRRSSMTQW